MHRTRAKKSAFKKALSPRASKINQMQKGEWQTWSFSFSLNQFGDSSSPLCVAICGVSPFCSHYALSHFRQLIIGISIDIGILIRDKSHHVSLSNVLRINHLMLSYPRPGRATAGSKSTTTGDDIVIRFNPFEANHNEMRSQGYWLLPHFYLLLIFICHLLKYIFPL